MTVSKTTEFAGALDFDAGTKTDVSTSTDLDMSEDVMVLSEDVLTAGTVVDTTTGAPDMAGYLGFVGGDERGVMQSFLLTADKYVSNISIEAAGINDTPGPQLTLELYKEVGGNPRGELIASKTQACIPAPGTLAFSLDKTAFLRSGVQYWAEFSPSGSWDNNSWFYISAYTTDVYADGYYASVDEGSITYHADEDLIFKVSGMDSVASGSWISELQEARMYSIQNLTLTMETAATAKINKIEFLKNDDTLLSEYATDVQTTTTLQSADFSVALKDIRDDWKVKLHFASGSTPVISSLSITSIQRQLYNEILRDVKDIIDDEFGTDFFVQIGGTSEPRRDENLPFVYITPMNIRTAFDPVGHETYTGHGEGQEWPITMSFIARRGNFVDGLSEAELLRGVGERMYKLARNIEEDISPYFTRTYDHIRYVYVSDVSTTLYNPETEQFRIDVGIRIEFNITR